MTKTPLAQKDYARNPGFLKLDLMIRGARVDDSVIKSGLVLPDYSLSPQVLGNLDLVLPQETYVSVPYQEENVQGSPYKIRHLKGKYYLSTPSDPLEVRIISHPSFYSDPVKEGVTIGDVAQCHGNYVSLALGGHRYLQPGLTSKAFDPKLVLSVDEVVGVLDRIRSAQRLDVVTFSAWQVDGEDGGISQIEPYIRAIKKAFNVLLFVEVHLPQTHAWIDATYAMGADSVCYHLGNLCSHGPKAPENSHRDMQVELGLLQHAVSIYPPGSVLSHITMGDRPLGDVTEDIDSLCAIRVLPILTFLSRESVISQNLTTDQLAPLFGYVYESAKKNRITMNWFSKLAPFIAPMEGRFFSGDSPRLKLALMHFYQSRLFGGSISVGLSNLRRKLRVKDTPPRS